MSTVEDEIKRLVAERNAAIDLAAMAGATLVKLEGQDMPQMKELAHETIDRACDLISQLSREIDRLKENLKQENTQKDNAQKENTK